MLEPHFESIKIAKEKDPVVYQAHQTCIRSETSESRETPNKGGFFLFNRVCTVCDKYDITAG
jgi:hypothetical protein